MIELEDHIQALLRAGGIDPGSLTAAEALPGGVSSDVTRFRGPRDVVVKRALAELKVGDGWRAELDRTANEVAFTGVLAQIAPEHALAVLAFDTERNIFAMQAAPEQAQSWKNQLMTGVVDPLVAVTCGTLLATIHTAGSRHRQAREIEGSKHFESLRLEPFLRYLLPQHPQVAGELGALIGALEVPGRHLVHGDFSPKNILVSEGGQVHLIDHEVAHLGDPAFDLAFVSTHLFLKAYHLRSAALLSCAQALLSTYQEAAGQVPADILGPLTAALMLARVDGRSQAEYLDDSDRELVRTRALSALAGSATWQDLHNTVAKDIST